MIGIRQVIEVDAWNGSAVVTIRCATGSFITKSTDTPSSTVIPGGIIDPGLLKYTMFSGGKTFGASSYGFGEAVINNEDKSLDYLKGYNFDGRVIRMYEAPIGSAFPSGFTQVYSAIVDHVSFAWDKVSFTLRNKQADLNIPVPAGVFAGNSIAPAGVEGSDDLKGKYKPFLLGRRFNITPVKCNNSKLIYAVSPATGISVTYMGSLFRVYDSGVELLYEGTYSNQADMEANEPSPGKYRVWEQEGYFRLGSPAAGVITCDAASYGRSVTARPGNLIRDLLTLAGIAYDNESISALTLAFRSEVGIFMQGGSLAPVGTEKPSTSDTIASALDLICSSCGAYWYFDRLNVLKVGQFLNPADMTIDYTINTSSTIVTSVTIQNTQDTVGGIPAYIVSLLRSENCTVQNDVAGLVTEERKSWLKERWRKTQIIDATIKSVHPSSEELQIETTLTQDNVVEATRRFNLYSVQRDLIEIVVPIDTFDSTSNLRPGLCIALSLEDTNLSGTSTRFGYINKKTALLGFTINRVTELLNLVLWG